MNCCFIINILVKYSSFFRSSFLPSFSQEEQEAVPAIEPPIESDEPKAELLTVIEQPEVPLPQLTANQAMKGISVFHVLQVLINYP